MTLNGAATALITLSITFMVQSRALQGKVVSIADGDTLTILTQSNQQIKIRLALILKSNENLN